MSNATGLRVYFRSNLGGTLISQMNVDLAVPDLARAF